MPDDLVFLLWKVKFYKNACANTNVNTVTNLVTP